MNSIWFFAHTPLDTWLPSKSSVEDGAEDVRVLPPRGHVGPLVAGADVPVDDVGAGMEAEIVDVEPGVHEAQARVEQQVTALLVEPHPRAVAEHRRGAAVDAERLAVGPLEVVPR